METSALDGTAAAVAGTAASCGVTELIDPPVLLALGRSALAAVELQLTQLGAAAPAEGSDNNAVRR